MNNWKKGKTILATKRCFRKWKKPSGKFGGKYLAANIPMEQGNKGNAMKSKSSITQQDIASALQRFISRGGVINHLPDQKYQSSKMIGDEKYQVYESISGLSKIANTGDSPL